VKKARKCDLTTLLQANLHLIYTYVSCRFTDDYPRLSFVMIANSRPLHYVPHLGAAMPWQTLQVTVADHGHSESIHPVVDGHRVASPERVVVCSTYTTEHGIVSSLPLSEFRAPGLVLMADHCQTKELRMPNQTSCQTDTVKPSFAENVFLLLMLL